MSEWAAVEGYEGRYEVSDAGEVRSLSFRQTGVPGLLKPNPIKDGYLQVKLAGKCFLVHRLVAVAFLGVCPDGMEPNHMDGNKANCAASNLEYLTHARNLLHAYRAGLQPRPRGEKNPAAKLSELQVSHIRGALASGATAIAIAPLFDVSRRTISAIKTGQNWATEGV